MAGKLFFAPLPPRAIGDQRLTGIHLRVLAAIALHDRMSAGRKAGQGCWAGNQKLAAVCGCNYNNLSTAITDLVALGYIERQAHPINKRLRVYRVIYNETDQAIVKARDSSPTGEGMSRPQTSDADPIVRPDFSESQSDQSLEGVEYIPLKREDIPLKREINSPEGAPLCGEGLSGNGVDENLGAELAKFERELKAGRIETKELHAWGDRLSEIHLDGDLDDPNAQRAGRLVDDVWCELERRGTA